ncbi:MAG: hypothetical protein K2K81_11175, partial [Muribaculaceae bacterium]|nr:hypothetical protein [Muribaculaceae bacterium]
KLSSVVIKLAFQNLKLQLPWGLLIENKNYNKETGILDVGEIETDANGRVMIVTAANGLNLLGKGEVKNGHLGIKGEVGIEDGSQIKLTINESVTIPSPIEIKADFEISGFSIEKFSGSIKYKMNDINIAPITLNDLPGFLDNPETNLIIANPKISVDILNPVTQYDLLGTGELVLSSTFNDGEVTKTITRRSDTFSLKSHTPDGKCKFTLIPEATDAAAGNYQFAELGYVLTNHNPNESEEEKNLPGLGLPKTIGVAIENLVFEGYVEDFPLSDIGSAEGNYNFTAPLGFGDGSKVVYESTESGWGSDDLDKVNITHVSLHASCSTNLPVSVYLKVVPVDKNNKEIEVDENSGKFHVPANANNEPVELIIRAKNGGTITDFDGVRFIATVEQNSGNTEAIGPDLHIILNDIRVTVDGYYETDF